MLGEEGIVVVIFDDDAKERRVVAVAAGVPWRRGWKKEGADVALIDLLRTRLVSRSSLQEQRSKSTEYVLVRQQVLESIVVTLMTSFR